MINKIIGTLNTSYGKFLRFPFVALSIGTSLFLLVNGGAVFPYWTSAHSNLVLIYMVMVITFVVMAKKESMKTIMQPMRIALFSFGVMFAIGLLVFNLMVSANFIHSAIFDESLYWQTIAVQIFVIATAEEVMFRGVLLGYTGIIISSVLFALWHSYAYEVIWYSSSISSVSIVAIIIAFLFGILLSFVARSKFGISGCIALHSSFNLVVLGVLIL